jgi:hypothetical protein
METEGSRASPAPEPTIAPEVPERRSTRVRRFPPRWRDYQATSYSPVTTVPLVEEEAFQRQISPLEVVRPEQLSAPDMSVPSPHRSPLNRFRICRVSATTPQEGIRLVPNIRPPPLHPFKNDSHLALITAFCLGPSSKGPEGMDAIAKLIATGRVVAEELQTFRATTELRRLDRFGAESPIAGGPWKTGSVKVKMPCTRAGKPTFSAEANAPEFEIHGIRYRSLVDLLTSKLQDPGTSESFVHTPFSEWWCPPGGATPVRIYGEAYSSDVAIGLYDEVRGVPPPTNSPPVENVIALLILGSDSTHLASFGTASLWPIYVFFGNMSKYDSSKPSEFAASHLAYLPKVNRPTLSLSDPIKPTPCQLPDNFADAYMKEFGIPPTPDVFTHCRRELYHEVIKLILAGAFAEAYKHGILIAFPDGITRRVFPRFYCYSADYPEKYVCSLYNITHPLT